MDISIINARLVSPDGIIEQGGVRVEAGMLVEIGAKLKAGRQNETIDAGGRLLVPGFVDIHADSLEAVIAPRPAAPFEPSSVLPSYDAELAMHGITTVFHCVGLAEIGDLSKSLRTRDTAIKIIRAIREFEPQALLRTKIHLRYEITDTESLPLLEELIDGKMVDLVSIMDHTPGFGVFKDLEAYRNYYLRSGQTIEAADQKFSELLSLRRKVDEDALKRVVRKCLQQGLTVVSHDDHTPEKLQWALDLGVSIAEFPVTLEAVDFSRKNGMKTVFGSPNLIRGISHAGNLRAADMIATNRADILCLDYSPRCSLPALFKAAQLNGNQLSDACRMFAQTPANSVGLGKRGGAIEVGRQADMILVEEDGGVPRVLATFVAGKPVYQTISSTRKPVGGLDFVN